MLKVEEIGFDDQVEFKMEGIVKDIEYDVFGIEIKKHEGQQNWIFVELKDIISIKKHANKKCYVTQEPDPISSREVDAAGNTPFTLAAQKQDWDEVRAMLKWGTDARHWNCFGINALYYALIYGQLDLAIELYDAGARLDGLNSDLPDEGSGNRILKLAAELQRTGRNIFFDERNTLLDCCRKGAYLQAQDKIRSASGEELTESISELKIRKGGQDGTAERRTGIEDDPGKSKNGDEGKDPHRTELSYDPEENERTRPFRRLGQDQDHGRQLSENGMAGIPGSVVG